MNHSRLYSLFFLVAPFILGYFVFCILAAVKLQLGIVLLATVLIGLWSLYNPAQPFFVALFLLPFERMTALFPPETRGAVTFLNTITIPKLMFSVIIVALITRAIILKKIKPIINFAVTPLPLMAILSLLISWISLVKANHYGFFFSEEMRMINNIVFFFLVIDLIDDFPKLQTAVKAICVSYFLVTLVGLYEIVTQTHVLEIMGHPLPSSPYVTAIERFRIMGPSGDPDYFGISMVFGLFITIMAASVFAKSKVMQSVLVLLSALYLFITLATGSRGTILSLLIGMAVFWFYIEIKRKYLISVIALIGFLAVFGLYTVTISDYALKRFLGEYGQLSLQYRIGWSKMCLKMAWRNPLLGVGTGNFVSEYNRYIDPNAPRGSGSATNTYLTILAENGLPGLIVYLAMYFFCFSNFYWVMKHSRDPPMMIIALTFFSITVTFTLFAAVHHTWVSEITWMVYGFSVVIRKIGDFTTPPKNLFLPA
jgi:O-antigen ligase